MLIKLNKKWLYVFFKVMGPAESYLINKHTIGIPFVAKEPSEVIKGDHVQIADYA